MENDVKLRIFNVAATVFNLRPFTSEELSSTDNSNPNLQTFETLLDTALDMAIREYDWSFLQSIITLGEDVAGIKGFKYGYKLPTGLFRLCKVGHESRYKRVGSTLYTDEQDPLVFGIMVDFDEDAVPRDFWDLIGYALAFLASNSISAGDSKANTALSLYQKLGQQMILNDSQNDSSDFVGYEDDI